MIYIQIQTPTYTVAIYIYICRCVYTYIISHWTFLYAKYMPYNFLILNIKHIHRGYIMNISLCLCGIVDVHDFFIPCMLWWRVNMTFYLFIMCACVKCSIFVYIYIFLFVSPTLSLTLCVSTLVKNSFISFS